MSVGRLGISFGRQGVATAGVPAIGGLFSRYGVGGLYVPHFGNLAKLFQDNAATTPVTADADPIGAVIDSSGIGTTITQSTGTSKPSKRTVSGRGVARFDSGDTLATNLTPSTAMTIAIAMTATAGGRYVYGSAGAASANRCYIAVNVTTGQLSAGVGDNGFPVITGTGTVIDVPGVAILRFDGSNVGLYWKPFAGAMVTKYSAAQSGSPVSGVVAHIGSMNENDTPQAPFSGDIFGAMVIKAAIVDADLAAVAAAFSR